MDNHNRITGCTGSAVKIRHCPATVKDEYRLSTTTAPSGKVTVRVLSQETGPVRQPRTLPRGKVMQPNLMGLLLSGDFVTRLVG